MGFKSIHAPTLIAALAAAFVLPGCITLKGEGTDQPKNDDPAAKVTHWQVRPVQMRLLPSTRFVQLDKQILLEARVEFQDDLKDATKAVGTLRFEVFAVNRQGQPVESQKLFHWPVEMLTREANQEYYDSVTRAYLFRLEVDKLPTVQRVAVRVNFVPPSGQRLESTAVMGVY